MKNYLQFLLFTFAIVTLTSCEINEDKRENEFKLWYNKPAKDWQSEALPIGNGYIGTMFFGGVQEEQIQFTEGTLWSGGPGTGKEYNFGIKKGAWKYLAEVRRLLDEGRMEEAHTLANKKLTGAIKKSKESSSSFGNYGAQQTMGDLFVNVHHKGNPYNYKRELNIEKALGKVSYTIDDIQYKRTYFASYPAKTLVYRFEADIVTDYTLNFKSPHKKNLETFQNLVYSYQGEVADNGMQFETCIKIETDGVVSFNNGKLEVLDAKYVNLYHVASTDYINKYPSYKGNDFKVANANVLQNIKRKTYQQLFEEHVEDYTSLYSRVFLELGENTKDSLSTDKRLQLYAKGEQDFGLEELYFQFGRYIMISSSRPGSMPMNLQGKWNDSTNPVWAADYHMNINQQMLYWPAEITNLSECHEPLFDYMKTLVEPGKITAKEFYNTRGWVVNTMNNPFGYTSPGWKFPWGAFPGGAAWLSQHLWEHYEFTQDKLFLEETAYPLMKESALFWMDYLIEDENGLLVSSPSYSPEHGGISRGASMDHQIAWDILNNCISAVEILGKDFDFKEEAIAIRNKISPPTLGKWGQLQEWIEDVDNPKSKHRHVSHLYAIYPGKQITMNKTPELAEAAKVSLNARGDGGTGWSLAWKINFWSRFKEGDRAYKLFRRLLFPASVKEAGSLKNRSGTFSNLFCAHPPFQLDGNMGGTAGIAEMLLQSHEDVIEILPALPKAWSKGVVKGLKVRGGVEVEMEWSQGKIDRVKLVSNKDDNYTIRYHGKEYSIFLKSGTPTQLNSSFELD